MGEVEASGRVRFEGDFGGWRCLRGRLGWGGCGGEVGWSFGEGRKQGFMVFGASGLIWWGSCERRRCS